jgi:hypothetical protein
MSQFLKSKVHKDQVRGRSKRGIDMIVGGKLLEEERRRDVFGIIFLGFGFLLVMFQGKSRGQRTYSPCQKRRYPNVVL